MQGTFLIRKGLSAIEQWVTSALRGLFILVSVSFLLISGCASLPDVNRLQNNMDTMAHYMGVMAGSMPMMAHNTARMADAADRMEQKSNALLNDLQKRGGTAERAIQNYSQALLDNERSMIKSLKGIQGELGELKQSLSGAGRSPRSDGKERLNAEVMSRLSAIETRLTALTSQMDQMNRQPSR